MSRGAVEGAATISGGFARSIPTAAPLAHFAGSRVDVPRAVLWHHRVACKCWRYFHRGTKCAPRRARRSSQTPHTAPTPPQSTGRRLGGHDRNCCSLCALPHSHPTLGTAFGRVGAVLAQDWRSTRRSFTPCELCMHPMAGITSHGREPACGFDDLPHWRGAICSKYDQCRILPRGATFEAIPGVGRRILVPDGDNAAACSGGKRTMPVFFSGATLPTLLGADRRIVCDCT
jgi:hypothetical protein